MRAGGAEVREPTADDAPWPAAARPRAAARAGAIGSLVDYIFLDPILVDPGSSCRSDGMPPTTLDGLTDARQVIADVGAVSYEADELEPPLRALARSEAGSRRPVHGHPCRGHGRTATPPLFDPLVALGHERTLVRLDAAREALAAAG